MHNWINWYHFAETDVASVRCRWETVFKCREYSRISLVSCKTPLSQTITAIPNGRWRTIASRLRTTGGCVLKCFCIGAELPASPRGCERRAAPKWRKIVWKHVYVYVLYIYIIWQGWEGHGRNNGQGTKSQTTTNLTPTTKIYQPH